jgi:hypothetical protein
MAQSSHARSAVKIAKGNSTLGSTAFEQVKVTMRSGTHFAITALGEFEQLAIISDF